MKDITEIPTADLLAEIKRRIEGDGSATVGYTPAITLKYGRKADEYLTAEERELLLAFVNQPEELAHIATFDGSPKVLTVWMYNPHSIRIGEEQDHDSSRYYYTSDTYNSQAHSHDIRLRAYAQSNALKRFAI